MVGNTLTDACDAVVELEVIGFQFHFDSHDLHYQGKEIEEHDGKQIPIPAPYIKRRLDLIKEHKPEIIEWLQTRSKLDIVRGLDRITDRIQSTAEVSQRNVEAWKRQTDLYQQQVDFMWMHFEKTFAVFLQIDAEVSSENRNKAKEEDSLVVDAAQVS